MTAPETLPEVALAFCREVLGWAECCKNGDAIMGDGFFYYGDLNIFMEAAQKWMKGKAHSVSLHCFDGELFVAVVLAGEQVVARSEPTAVPCHALMAACVAASRKLKGAAP